MKPGHKVGPWRIVESLGSGNFGHAFKAERDGGLFTLKMAVRPAPELPRYTEALLPDGRRFPVCFILGIGDGYNGWGEGSKPGAVVMRRLWAAMPVYSFPRH